METTIMGYIGLIVYGWLSKLWSLFGSLIIIWHLIFKGTQKRDHRFDNHPYGVYYGALIIVPKTIFYLLNGDYNVQGPDIGCRLAMNMIFLG